MSTLPKPNAELELSRLRSFQRDTVEHVFERMYLSSAPARRFLVADEVGLGKTMVARGLVAKVIEHLWDDVKRIDVVYICSNGSIARQNINRLNVSDAKDASLPSRITLLPKVVKGLKSRKLNFISLTPQTSFDLRSSLGRWEERSLLYWLLPEEWKQRTTAVQNLLQGGADRDRFRRRVSEFEHEDLDPDLKAGFQERLLRSDELKAEFVALADRFDTWRKAVPDEDRDAQNRMVGRLRMELAVSCLGALEPDLIILDEFQRFKHLLDGTDQAGDLAHQLFGFGDARVLLLSATPYKMYTIAEESETDDHFRDFLQTVDFLQHDSTKTATFKAALDRYRDAVFGLGDGTKSGGALLEAKASVEAALRLVMVRTERLAASSDRNGMLVEVLPGEMGLSPADVASYLANARVATATGHDEVIEYWKSAPYLLNFMDDYELKRGFEAALSSPKSSVELRSILSDAPESILSWDDVERYRPLDPANARVRRAIGELVSSEAWRLLWLPPALPYYQLAGAFEGHEAGAGRVKKQLIFSSWKVVPKVVSALLSYEAERLMFGDRPDVERPNTPHERDRNVRLLRFSRSDGRLTGMSILGLLYPSTALAEIGDSLRICRRDPSTRLSSDTMLREVAESLRPLLKELEPSGASGQPDESWYWAAPLLLDLARHPDSAKRWLAQDGIGEKWRSDEEEVVADEDAALDAWGAHVAEFLRAGSGQIRLGPQPPDLPDVLARVALGAPATVALRALSRIAGGTAWLQDASVRNQAGWVAWSFISLFNLPEVTAMLRRENSAEPYWHRVLDYCVAGCLQAVMDEYVHVLQEFEGVSHRPVRQATKAVASRAAEAARLRTTTVAVDAIAVEHDRVAPLQRRTMRSRFAARFGARQTDEGAGAVRADDLRYAFNSPFWPFVLCSTSVGQEGLDFHLYCHTVVHWNLPSNPVDLEQREGRVHRYKGHAIRKNAALLYGAAARASDAPDPWDVVFQRAREDRPDNTSDLIPYWILQAPGGALIERHVPALPLSRDVEQAKALKKTLTVYRMAFGQNRQDDVVAYLTSRLSPEEIDAFGAQLRVDLTPPARTYNKSTSGGWERPVDHAEPEAHVDGEGRSRVSIERAESLLDEFVKRQSAIARIGIERYQDLLDQFVRFLN